MAANENFKVSILCVDVGGQSFVFDYGFHDDSGGAVHIDTNQLASDFQTAHEAAWRACLHQDVQIARYRAACVLGAHKGEVGYIDTAPGVAGTYEGDLLPREICMAFRRSTGYASRRDRGRIFFGPLTKDRQTNANPDICAPQAVDFTLCDTLKANLLTQTVTLKPVILAADGTYSGHLVNKVAIASIFCHRKTRRFRAPA